MAKCNTRFVNNTLVMVHKHRSQTNSVNEELLQSILHFGF
jgi:hypothetical protein